MGLKQSKFKCLQGESDGKIKRRTSKNKEGKKTQTDDFEFVKSEEENKISDDVEIKVEQKSKTNNAEFKNEANTMSTNCQRNPGIEKEPYKKQQKSKTDNAEVKKEADITATKCQSNPRKEPYKNQQETKTDKAEVKKEANTTTTKCQSNPSIEKEQSPDSTEIPESEKLRHKGNDSYKSAMTKGLSSIVALSRLQTVNNFYTRALDASLSNKQRSSAAKNIGMTSWKMGMIVFNKDKDMSLTCRHFRDAFKNLKSAFEYGSTCMSATWKSKLEISCGKCWNDFYLCVSEIAMEQRVRTLDAVLPYLSKSNQIHAFFEIANVQFHVGINAFQKGDFKKCMYQMSECHYPIEKVKELRGFEETHHELQSLEEDVVMHLSITESSQSRQTGDDLLKMVLIDEETLNIEMVWDIIDWYRQAIVLTRDLDMEMEAIALSRLGVVYDKVLKLKPKAKECFMASVRLAESMHPRTFNTTDWYIESTSTLKRYQQETVQHEEEEKAKERAEIKEKMKEELNALDKDNSNMQNKEFLKHLYNKYKPKNSNHIFEEFNEDSSVETKKRLQKAIVHFHPDKVNAEEHGWEWKIMTEEITKYLTRRYEVIKAEI